MTESETSLKIEASGIKVRCAYDRLEEAAKLVPHPANPNKHPAKQLELFHKIIQFQGWRRAITVSNLSGFVTRGHGALEMALQVGLTQVPVDYQDYDSEQEELADLVADNQLAHLAAMDNAKLQKILVQIDTGAFDMELTAFDTPALERLFTSFGEAPAIGLTKAEDGPSENSIELGQEESAAGTDQSESPVTHTRMVQLFLNEGNISEFMTIMENLGKVYGTENVTDTVLEAVRRAERELSAQKQ